MKYTTSPELRPPPHIYGDEYERSSDPWHKAAFPVGLERAAPVQADPRREGWMALDSFGNAIGFVPDGEPVEATPKQIREMKPDMQYKLMQIGADTAEAEGLYTPSKGVPDAKR